ncbi:MAG: 5'-methylthioadenosine/S-adenosylhomocysteine nucleosidase [candidate division Zixibacteria bacterium]|nr:5'-methylthioadenosine/S-adenosylhomocysteine nucleosidase [candidate division Zixibacteria bacterium]
MSNSLYRTAPSRLLLLAACLIFLIAGCCTDRPTVRPYLILYAFYAEGELIGGQVAIEKSEKHLGRTVLTGQLCGRNIVLAESGVGMTNAAMTTQRMIDTYHPKGVIFTGIAGAIDSSVHIGDIVVCRSWVQHDYGYIGAEGFSPRQPSAYLPSVDSVARPSAFLADSSWLAAAGRIVATDLGLKTIGERIPKFVVAGTGASGNTFIDSREKRQWLSETFAALIVDMESAAVAHVCAVNDLPFIAFRSASDLAGGSGSASAQGELSEFFHVAADNSSSVVMKFLEMTEP